MLSVFYAVLGAASGENSFFLSLLGVMAALLPITALSYDEKSNWDKYALTMPIERKDIVLCKYVLSIILSIFVLIISLTYQILIKVSFEKAVETSVSGFCVALLTPALILPILFKFGVEKGRIMMLCIIALPSILFYCFIKIGIRVPDFNVEDTFSALVIFILAVLVLTFLSALISIRIYKKREL